MSFVGDDVKFKLEHGWVESTLAEVLTQSASRAARTVDPAAAKDPMTTKIIPHNKLNLKKVKGKKKVIFKSNGK